MYPRDFFDTYWRPDLLDEVFVAMPFSDEFTPIWETVIRAAIEEDQSESLSAHRVDATVLAGSVITEILEGVARARLVLADISITSEGSWIGQRNGNVMYEVGLAHAVRQASEIILIRSDHERINFDIAGIKIYDYDKTQLSLARECVATLIKDHLDQIEQFKALKVELAIRSLDGECLKLMTDQAANRYFGDLQPRFQAQVATLIPQRLAVAKLLELGITYCEFNSSESSYAYHWTEFGYAVLHALGIRKSGAAHRTT